MRDKEKQREYARRKYEEALPAYHALMKYYPLTLDNLDGEVWKEIDGFDKYQVSNYGRIKSFWGKEPRILKPYLPIEYLSVALCGNGKKKHQKVHILVAKAFIPNPDHKPEVNHDDGHKFNCHVSNLYWATSAENNQHAVKNGLSKSGVEHSQSKIKDEKDIIYIRDNPDHLTQQQLAEMFGVGETTISDIQLGKTYQNAGGIIRQSKFKRVPDEIRNQIKADWATGNYSYAALGKKFGYCAQTIWNIIHEVD